MGQIKSGFAGLLQCSGFEMAGQPGRDLRPQSVRLSPTQSTSDWGRGVAFPAEQIIGLHPFGKHPDS